LAKYLRLLENYRSTFLAISIYGQTDVRWIQGTALPSPVRSLYPILSDPLLTPWGTSEPIFHTYDMFLYYLALGEIRQWLKPVDNPFFLAIFGNMGISLPKWIAQH
jgi:hypothetical protein